ncbi:MAG: hypothetical protein ACREFP_10410 [Acetobacteraceae bacterium]
MKPGSNPCCHHGSSVEATSHAVCLYHGSSLGLRGVAVILAEHDLFRTGKIILRWCREFGEGFAKKSL